MKTLAFTVVTVLSFAALPAIAQDTDPAEEEEAIEQVVEEVVADEPTPTVETDLPVTLPDPAAAPAGRLDTPEAVFLADALRDGEMEIAAAALARDRSEDAGVKALAERLENDHRVLVDRLSKLREADAATEPRGRPAHPEQARLQTLEGAAFDAAWLAVQRRHFDEAIRKYERASASPALDVEVRSAASETLTTLRALADAITDMQDSLGFE